MIVHPTTITMAPHIVSQSLHIDWRHNADILIGKPIAIVVLIFVALLIRWVLGKLVDRLVRHAEEGDRFTSGIRTRRVQRAKTMGDLLKSIVTGLLIAVFGTMVLGEVGVNIAPIIASAGIVGLALGFGAQSLVKDFLSGIFMIFEDQFGVGDVVDIGVASGTVEAVSLRVTRLRDTNGTVWYVPNGEILKVGNMSQNWARAVVDVSIGYGEDLARVQHVLKDVAHDIWQDDAYQHVVIEEPEVTGVETMTPDAITVRVLIKTAPMQQWAVARELRQRIKARFDHEGIAMPFTQKVLFPTPGYAGSTGATTPPAEPLEEITDEVAP